MKTTALIIGLLFLFSFQIAQGQSYDYLRSVTATGSGTTTDDSKAWTDITSVSLDLGSNITDTKYVLLTASINMRPDGASNNGREANYNIYRSDLTTDESGVIKRQMIKNTEADVLSWGIGTLVHIFDVSSLSGSKTYTLEHSNQGVNDPGRNVYSSVRLTAVALSTESNHFELSNDVKRLDADITTTSEIYAAVTGLTTDAITLPIKGDIFVTASINGKANGAGSVAEYKLEYSTDDGSNWSDLGKPVKRSMVNTYDDGIISLTCMLTDQDADNDFKFRVAHRRVSGTRTITTHNCNLVALALAHSGGGYFPSFCSEVGSTGVDITGVSTAAEMVTSSSFTAASDIGGIGTGLFVNSQYLVSAAGLDDGVTPDQRMRSGNILYVNDGTTTTSAEEYYRYIPDNNNFGAGGFIGLMSDLEDGGSYTIGMKHEVAFVSNPDGTEDEVLTTSEVILTGFQTYDQPSYNWDGSTDTDWSTAANWSSTDVPGISDDVYIPSGLSNYPVLVSSATADCNNLEVASGASLTIEDGGSLITNGTVSGDATIEKDISSGAWHLISVPNTVTTANTFYGDYLEPWSETAASWSNITEPTDALTPVQGYGFKVQDGSGSYTFTGAPNTGNQSIAVTYTTNSSGNDYCNLLGNPYPSPIDWADLDDTWGSVYYWNGAAYVTWNNGSGTGSQYIAPIQGFFIVTGSAGTFSLTNANRTHSGATAFYKSANTLTNGIVLTASNGSYLDELYLVFDEEASETFELQNDAYKLLSSTEGLAQLYSFNQETKFSIDVRPEEGTIQLGFKNDKDGVYQIGLKELEGISGAYLEDTKLSIFHNLENGDYQFDWTTTDNEKRFKFHLNTTGLEDLKADLAQLYAYQKTLYIQSKENLRNANIRIIDVTGREVYQQKLNSQDETISLALANGVYTVVLSSDEGVQIKKIIFN